MLKILFYYYLIVVNSNVNVLGERFQACDSSSDNDEFNPMGKEQLGFDETQEENVPLNVESFIPPNMPCKMKYLAQITWPSGAHVLSGGIVNYNDISEKPKVIWPCDGTKLYGLVFADLEAVLAGAARGDVNDREWGEYLWFMYNIPGNRINEGIEVKRYRRPVIKEGSSRVVIAVHEQNKRINLENINDSEEAADEAFLKVFKTFNGTLVAANMFTVVKE